MRETISLKEALQKLTENVEMSMTLEEQASHERATELLHEMGFDWHPDYLIQKVKTCRNRNQSLNLLLRPDESKQQPTANVDGALPQKPAGDPSKHSVRREL